MEIDCTDIKLSVGQIPGVVTCLTLASQPKGGNAKREVRDSGCCFKATSPYGLYVSTILDLIER